MALLYDYMSSAVLPVNNSMSSFLNRTFESLQMVLLVHAFYIAGITNFGDFISDQKGPWCVQVPLGLEF